MGQGVGVCHPRSAQTPPLYGESSGMGRTRGARKGPVSDNPHRSRPLGPIRVVAPLETDLSRSKWILHAFKLAPTSVHLHVSTH